MTKPTKYLKSSLPKYRGKIVLVDSSIHRVFYRAVQVENCVPCREPLAVGMRVAVLENRSQFSGNPEPPMFYAAIVDKIQGGIVTLKYESHPYAVSLMTGVKEIECFCIPLKSKGRGGTQ